METAVPSFTSKTDHKVKAFNYNDQGLQSVKHEITLMHQSFEILNTLLKNLLSSHVDHFRDVIIINNAVNLILILIDFLGNIYRKQINKQKIRSKSII